MTNETRRTVNTNLMTNLFLKFPIRSIRFFRSSMGPRTIKPITELIGMEFAKVLAIKASDVEQMDRIKAANIMDNTERIALPPKFVIISFGIYT